MSGTVARRGGGGSVGSSSSSNNLHRSITVTPFLNKLYRMVDDDSGDDLIRWSEDGNSFVVLRHEEFAKEVLPRFFKHSNFSSFVRQLNMYDFHKVPHLQQGGLIADGPEAESWEFSNENFQRGQPDLLHFIRRKKSTRDNPPFDHDAANGPADEESLVLNEDEVDDEDENGDAGNRTVPVALEKNNSARANMPRSATPVQTGAAKTRASRTPPATLAQILKEIQVIRDHQMTISSDIKRLQEENQSLWIQASTAEERHKQHQYTIDNILQFLATVFRGEARQSEIHPPLRRLIMNSSKVAEDDDGNDSDSRTYSGQAQQRQQRLSNKSSGYATPTTGAAGFASHTQDIFEDADFADMFDDQQQQQQQQPPPEKRPRTGSSRSSRIYEMSSPAEPASQASTPKGTGGRQSATPRVGGGNTTTVRRKVPSPQSTALTRTVNRSLISGTQLPPMFDNAMPKGALVPAAGPSLSAINSRTKSIEQLQQEIDSLGVSLDHLTRQLHSGANRDAGPDPLLPAQLLSFGSAAIGPTMTTSTADMMLQSLSTSKADVDSLLTSDAFNDLALALTVPDTTLSSHGLGSTISSELNRTNLAHLPSYPGNPPTAAPAFDSSVTASAAANSTYSSHTAQSGGSNTFESNWLLEMLRTCTPEQYESLQNFFKLISPSDSNPAAPVLAATDHGVGHNSSPIVSNANLTPFLDFVDPQASGGGLVGFDTNGTDFFSADAIDSSAGGGAESYSHGGLGSVGGSADNDYAQIFLEALNSDSGATVSPAAPASKLQPTSLTTQASALASDFTLASKSAKPAPDNKAN
ncbi:Heat shock transcription factor [Coemansia sp. BCRC 34301]|nr:Heat shock transcription factor [Coemansia sp. BCRC 34301]